MNETFRNLIGATHKPYREKLIYLESTGTQYIDTGFAPNSLNFRVDVWMDVCQVNKNPWGFCSKTVDTGWFAPYSNNTTNLSFYCGTSLNIAFYRRGENGVKRHLSAETTTSQTLKLTDDDMELNTTFNGTFINDPGNFYLFAMSGPNLRINASRIWGCHIYQDGILIRELIPVLDRQGVPCMFDKVTKQFFYNKGTGTFNYK